MEMYDNTNTAQKSFDENYLSEELIQAQWAELIELKKVIAEIYLKKGVPIAILDIGIGNARIVKHLSAIPEMWNMIKFYDGTDNAETCANLSRKTAKELNIEDKVTIYFLDAVKLNQLQKQYDLIITTWFTAGNFYPENFPFENYNLLSEKINLSKNEKFETIFNFAYERLITNGEILIGAFYIDNENTREKQELSYKKMGMTIITDAKDSFTATKERFWSQRFTKEKIYQYFKFVKPEKISFTLLDPYDYAMQVRIKK
ncbi:hypothetical protein ACNQGL_13980 [Flavobacterium sp. LB3P21]|uniref:hypothetical protein n=1 Tax=Flavobacterium sp. LB3P21 TaxID=3401719 RepID=UPI003AAB3DE0